jgi:hypothetical protein
MSQLNSQRTYLYSLYNEIIYDPLCNIYINILTLNKIPEGMLKPYTKLMALTKPSLRDLITKECSIVINNEVINNEVINNEVINNEVINNEVINNKTYNTNSILTLDNLNEFTEFLINNNYIITDYSYNNSYNNNNSKKIIYSFKITL